MKKVLMIVCGVALFGIGYVYYEIHADYRRYRHMSEEEQTNDRNTSPIRFMIMKRMIFWADL